MMRALPIALALAAGAALPALAQDRADIDRTQIIGNRELPKVLYIVPWKKPLPGQLSGRPVQSVLDEALAPVDRQVFRRQVAYNTQVQAREAPAAAPSIQPVVAPVPTPTPAPAPAPAPAATPR
jgi:hypothetical protein